MAASGLGVKGETKLALQHLHLTLVTLVEFIADLRPLFVPVVTVGSRAVGSHLGLLWRSPGRKKNVRVDQLSWILLKICFRLSMLSDSDSVKRLQILLTQVGTIRAIDVRDDIALGVQRVVGPDESHSVVTQLFRWDSVPALVVHVTLLLIGVEAVLGRALERGLACGNTRGKLKVERALLSDDIFISEAEL